MGVDPISMMAIAGGAQLAGSVMGGISNQNAANAQSQIAANNATIAASNAHRASMAGNAQAEQQGLKARYQVGSTKAIQGASGIDVNTGSAAAVRGSEARIGMLDALNIRSKAAQQAYGYQLQGQQDIEQSKLDRAQAKAAIPEAIIGSVGGAAKTGSSMLSMTPPGGGGGGNLSSITDDSGQAVFAND
jgi:hypothetical protein